MKLMIIDDHALVRQGVLALLEREVPGAELLQACDSAEGLRLAARHGDLDAVFLDLSMPGMDGMDALREFRRARPALPVIVLTAADDPALARQAFAVGALGYVPKSASADTLLMALSLVMRGEAFVPSLMQRTAHPIVAGPVPPPASFSDLTERQSEVLRYLGEGLSNKAIAHRMGITEKTIKAHMTGVLRALDVSDRQQAVQSARAAGII
ncbi:MAG: response regulator transcription factor [Phenylobacterium sp.]|uniref:response regulator n=1 Tax=Phenylobacterium sp. TaxID=1871053 RepID=UPI001214F9D9|nr:response regulator transcription factor [Phenylobacterium sp.]TAJ70200.1 MAG: response regulator transcription factor [Phenylobacterium sp.]